jgi:TPR repeat protein
MFIKTDIKRFCIVLALGGLSFSASANEPSSSANTNKLIERPKWMPELPKINNKTYAPDSVIYNDLRKRIIEKKDKKAVTELYTLAKRNHIPSIVLLGYLFDDKKNGLVEYNPKTAAQYWAISAKAGDAVSIYNLAILYFNGRGVPRNLPTAESLADLAAKKGMRKANYLLGQIYEMKGFPTTAIGQYNTCMQSRPLVQCKTRYGILMVTKTKLNSRDAKQVVNLLAQASNDGDLDASYTLARLAAEGVVVAQSNSSMVYYLESMVRSPNSKPKDKELAAKMYKAYQPTAAEIKKGKDNYRIANSGNMRNFKFTPIDLTKTVLDLGNSFE